MPDDPKDDQAALYAQVTQAIYQNLRQSGHDVDDGRRFVYSFQGPLGEITVDFRYEDKLPAWALKTIEKILGDIFEMPKPR